MSSERGGYDLVRPAKPSNADDGFTWGEITGPAPQKDVSPGDDPSGAMGATGGGAMYNCRPITKLPKFIDPATNLWVPADRADDANPNSPPNPGEKEPETDTAWAENAAEANLSPADPPSHWVPYGAIVPMWKLKKTKAGKKVFRFHYLIPGTMTANIAAAVGAYGVSLGGSGRYWGRLFWPRPAGVDFAGTNFGQPFPDKGETVIAPGGGEYYIGIENLWEEGTVGFPNHPINLLPIDGSQRVSVWNTGGYTNGLVPAGFNNTGLPVPIYRCETSPGWLPYAWAVPNGGDPTLIPPTQRYDVYVPNATGGGAAQQILSQVSPAWGRPAAPIAAAGGMCTVRILPNGTLQMVQINEQGAFGYGTDLD